MTSPSCPRSGSFLPPLLRTTAIILASVFLSWVVLNNSGHETTGKGTTESAYDRVIRTGTLRCGYFAWPPFFEKDAKTGALTGMIKDMMDEMTGMVGLKVEYVEAALGQQPQDLASGKYDAYCLDTYLMPKASKFVDYTKPWGYIPMYVYGRTSAPDIAQLQELNSPHYTFSTVDGDLSLDLAVRSFPQAKLLSLPSTADASLLMLNITTQKADAIITDDLTIQRFNRTNADGLKRLYNRPVAVYPHSLSLNKGETDLQNMLNYALDIFIYTGNYETILDKYDPDRFIIRVDTKRN